MTLLVTGGCGFIGSCFITYLLRKYPDLRIVNLDAMTYAAHPESAERLAQLGERYQFVKEDISSPRIGEILQHYDIGSVVNFAAETHVDRSILDPAAFVQTNVLGVQNLLTWTRKLGNIRFVHVSTDEVYGTLAPEQAAVTEEYNLDPNSPYAASKASADLIALASARTYGQEVLITRCTNNYGPYQFPEKLIPLVIANAIENLPVPVYGDGQQVRDWIYVEDHCRAIDLVLHNGKRGEVYNVSAKEERRNLEVVKKILDLLGKPHSLIHFVGDRPAHDRRYALNADKIRRELQWEPKSTFDQGLELTVSWYVNHEAWWKSIRAGDYQAYYRANYNSKFQPGLKEEVRVK